MRISDYFKQWMLRILLITIGFGVVQSLVAETSPLNGERKRELEYLLKHDCGSCHGMRLKGGLGPALLPEALAGKPKQYLKQVISKGMPNTAMPPWGKLLSTEDIDYLVFLLKPKPDAEETEL